MEKLLRMKGIGIYIASAVLNFGCYKPTPVVDVNVLRVFNRLIGITREKEAREVITKICRYGDHRIIAFALIDLGALVCRDDPKCNVCPLAHLCRRYPLRKERCRMLGKVMTKDGKIKLQEQPISRKDVHSF
jgi:A/G-specific adenine glycosylase